MSSKIQREQARARNRRKKMATSLTWGAIGLAVLAVIGFLVWQGVRPAAGTQQKILYTRCGKTSK